MIIKFLEYIKEDLIDWVEDDDKSIKVNIYSTGHSTNRKYYLNNNVTDDKIVNMVQKSLEIFKHDMKKDRVKINQRFVIEEGDVHIVCALSRENRNYRLDIITIFQDDKRERRYFIRGENQYIIDLDMNMSYKHYRGKKKYYTN